MSTWLKIYKISIRDHRYKTISIQVLETKTFLKRLKGKTFFFGINISSNKQENDDVSSTSHSDFSRVFDGTFISHRKSCPLNRNGWTKKSLSWFKFLTTISRSVGTISTHFRTMLNISRKLLRRFGLDIGNTITGEKPTRNVL